MRSFLFRELCDRMRFEVDYAKSHHRLISEGLALLLEIEKFDGLQWEVLISTEFYFDPRAHKNN